jgi:hypothetical protein
MLVKGSGERPTTSRPAFPVAERPRCVKCGGVHRAPECWPPPADLEPLTPSPARDVATKIDPATIDVEELARFLFRHDGIPPCEWDGIYPGLQSIYRQNARAIVRDLDDLEPILARLYVASGRF